MKNNYPDTADSTRHWLHTLSPCALGIVICIGAIIYNSITLKTSGSFRGVVILLSMPAILILAVIDAIVKGTLKDKLFYIWATELLLIGAGILFIWRFLVEIN
jgi:hypothetical protein